MTQLGPRIMVFLVGLSLAIVLLLAPVSSSALPLKVGSQAPRIANAGPSSPFAIEETSWDSSNGTTLANYMATAGAKWTRYGIQWAVVQPTETFPPQYDWTQYDSWLADPAAQGLTMILIIADTPDWAALDRMNSPSGAIAPQHMGEFVSFVQAAVAHFSQPQYNVRFWELYNEPDMTDPSLAPWIAPWGNYGKAYADMLQAVYPAIKQADPQATVLMGGLAYERFLPQGGPFNQNFVVDVLTELNRTGSKGFDVFNFHYYAAFATVWAPYGVDIVGKTNYLRKVLASKGYGSVPMVCTEIGQFGIPGNPTSLQAQADYVPQVYARGMSAGLRAMVWYSLVVGTDDTGLLDANLKPKPAYQTYKVAASELGATTFAFTIPPGSVQLQGASPASFEGYLFTVNGTGGHRAVVWLNAGSGTLSVRVSSLTVTTETGGQTPLMAGQNGTVSVAIGTSPVYLDLASIPWAAAKVYLPYVSRH